MQWYLNVLKNYVGFSGRARRKEYWMFYLFNIIVSFVITIIDSVLGLNAMLLLVYSLAVLLPGLAVTVRRLHDIDKSGWWILISLIPIVGGIVLLIFTCLDSQPEENQFGANPKRSFLFIIFGTAIQPPEKKRSRPLTNLSSITGLYR